KVSPPLRAEDDRTALVQALSEGLLDVVMSDHNPQDVETKRLPFAEAAPGAVGLETMLAADCASSTTARSSSRHCSRPCRRARPNCSGCQRAPSNPAAPPT